MTIREIQVKTLLSHGHRASYIVPWLGMSPRDRQRAYYGRLHDLFPGLRRKHEQALGDHYSSTSHQVNRLPRLFDELREQRRL
jgi:hypothetical protein